jgi:outer membrane protein assembly factor BamB
MASDGSLIAVLHTLEGVYLFNFSGEIVWTNDNFGGRLPMITKNGSYLITQIRRHTKDDPFFLVKIDQDSNIIWKREIGLIGVDGLAITPDALFVAVGYVDQESQGHINLIDQNGSKLWDHHIDGRIETVAVSKSGYVVAGPRDRYIYVYDVNGELIFKYYANSLYDSQDITIAPDETFFLFGSEHTYLNCYTLEGERVWQKEVGPLCNIRISQDSEYIAVGTSNSKLFLFDRNGNELWGKKVTDTYFVHEVAISAHGEYIAVDTMHSPWLGNYYLEVYSTEGTLLWRYQGINPFIAIAMSDDGHYIATGSRGLLVFFDNLQAIEEYALSECESSESYN